MRLPPRTLNLLAMLSVQAVPGLLLVAAHLDDTPEPVRTVLVLGSRSDERPVPRLSVPPDPRWERERFRALLTVNQDGEVRRQSMDRRTGADTYAAIVVGAADRSWNAVIRGVWPYVFHLKALYLGGEGPWLTVGAVPFLVPVPWEYRKLGPNLILRTWPGDAVVVRVTRAGDRVRFRWHDLGTRPRWTGGDVTLSSAEVEEGGPAILDDLRRRIGTPPEVRRFTITHASGREEERTLPPWRLVFLQAIDRARFVDVLRVVECGHRPRTFFWPEPLPVKEPERLRLTRPPTGTEGQLVEVLDLPETWDERVVANVLSDDGSVIVKRQMMRRAEFESYLETRRAASPDLALELRVDRDVPWRGVRPLVRLAGESPLLITYASEPGLNEERILRLPPPSRQAVVRVQARPNDDGELETAIAVTGAVTVLRIPDDATWGAVARLVLRLRARGETVAFE